LEPVWPSRIEHELHLIEVETERTLRFAELQSLAPLVIFAERVTGLVLRNSQPVDWDSWRQQHAR